MAFAWVDGHLVEARAATVPLLDRGFLQGEGCFETIRLHRGAPFRWEAHLDRLGRGLGVLGIAPPSTLGEARPGARRLVEAAGLGEGLLRITVSPGDPAQGIPGTVALTLRDLPLVPPRVALHVSRATVRQPGPLAACKTTSRAPDALALAEAKARGGFDALLLNVHGTVVETTARNVFAVVQGVVVTPSVVEGALPGVTRAEVLALAQDRGIKVREGGVSLATLAEAEEVFVTGSGVGVLGVAAVDAMAYPCPGPTTVLMAEGYREALAKGSRW